MMVVKMKIIKYGDGDGDGDGGEDGDDKVW